jgi:cytoskeletal protein CcmA (bactofilin family)
MTVPYTFANQYGNVPVSEIDANFVAVSNNVSTANTVVNGAQPNITSVGTLSALNVSGNITSANLSVTGTIIGNVEFEQSLSVAGNVISNNVLTNMLTFNSPTTASISVGNIALYGQLSATGNVYANGNIAMVSNLPRNVYVANTAPGNTAGNIGDIWYQTFRS